MKRLFEVLLFVFVFSLNLGIATSVFAEPLGYAGREDGLQPSGRVSGSMNSKVTPVSYTTNYDTQFSSTSSFMQPPGQSTGSLQYQYGRQSVSPVDTTVAAGINPTTAADPYGASEVSPYSRYSPYIEIVGEGSDYTLGVDDVITIVVRNQPDFSGRFVVDPEGNVQYNFVGDIKAAGKRKEELKAELTERLKKFVRYPEVAVMISEYRSKAVYVFGYVNQPGKYAMKGDKITVKEAVVAAGLPRFDAAVERVLIIRPSDKNPDGKPSKTKIDLKRILNEGQSAEDFVLEPGDTVVVNQRYFDKFVNNFSRIVGPVFQSAALYELGFGDSNGGFFNSGDN